MTYVTEILEGKENKRAFSSPLDAVKEAYNFARKYPKSKVYINSRRVYV